jgi:uncharacterized protein YdhG (YjbR/CyaY superfamily)
MDPDVQNYLDGIPAEHRPLFDRVHRLILEVHPEAAPVLSYGMPTYRVGARRLYVGVWRHGISLYGWGKDRAAEFIARHPALVSGKGTIQLRSTAPAEAEVSDDELRDLVRAALAPDPPA